MEPGISSSSHIVKIWIRAGQIATGYSQRLGFLLLEVASGDSDTPGHIDIDVHELLKCCDFRNVIQSIL